MIVLLAVVEAAARLRMGRNAVYELIKRREIAVVKRGRKIFIPESEVERFIQQEIIPAKRNYFGPRRSMRQLQAAGRLP